MYFNLHTHFPTSAPDVLEIESVYFGQSAQPVSAHRSVGLHPCHLDVDTIQARAWLRAQESLPGTLAIGEAGLDKTTDTPWNAQLIAFQYCYQLAEVSEKPLVIHCVRAYEELLACKKRWSRRAGLPPTTPGGWESPRIAWILHGFNKNTQTAQMLLQAGCFLSFGAALLNEKSHSSEALHNTPPGRFFLETDASNISIEAVYERAAEVRGLSVEALQKQVWANFSVAFKAAPPL